MTNTILVASVLILLMVSLLLLVWLTSKSPAFTEKLRESLFRNIGVPYRNLLGLLLGATASILLLSGAKFDMTWIVVVFVVALVSTMALLIFVRPYDQTEVDRFAWGLIVIVVLGFGVGALTYQYRHWIKWLWHQYLRINLPHELLLESLFLLGIILGFFVVRNWAKDQKDFISSLSAVLSGAFVATILGKLQGEGINEIGALRAFAYYALGFTLSGTINLLAAARLTANYINKRSVSSRAMLDFLYGSERTKLIDGYFLKNFRDDPDYAKRWLTDILIEHRRLVRREFAEKMQERKKERERKREKFVHEMIESCKNWDAARDERKSINSSLSDDQIAKEASLIAPGAKNLECLDVECRYLKQALEQVPDESTMDAKIDKILTVFEERRIQLKPACSKLKEAEDEIEQLTAERESISAISNLESRHTSITKRLKELADTINVQQPKCDKQEMNEWKCLELTLRSVKPSYYYELIAIECEGKEESPGNTTVPANEREYGIIYRRILSSNHRPKDDSLHQTTIQEDMFRIGIAMRWQDTLEYIVAPGQYGAPFPVLGSVAGLALLMGKTIVMDRDKNKKFRSKDYGRGVCPGDIEQPRGLDEITFLSYFSIPVIARMGSPSENALGICNVDTKLFATHSPLAGEEVKGSEGIFRIRLNQETLSRFASNLYEEEDKAVQYVEDHTKIITPVLELYSKCRVGAI